MSNLSQKLSSFFCLILLNIVVPVEGLKVEEPLCTSKFDYDYKMLQKMVMLEMEYNKLTAQMKEHVTIIENLEAQLKDEREKHLKMETKIRRVEDTFILGQSVATFATYIRWGRTACPENGTELVYKGYAAGSHYTKQGSAANFLCLPEEPTWNVYQDGEQLANGVYGVEYEFMYRDKEKFFGKNLAEKDAPCCVCQTKRSVVMMIPGRNKCFDGWTLEYQGYLVAGSEGHYATEFVCLDEEAEALSGGASSADGRLLYMTEAKCGALRCPPYIQGRELTCSVCSM